MKKYLLALCIFMLSQAVIANDYDLNAPFGFCALSSRTDASSTYDITGGGCYTYPIPDDFEGTVKVLTSTGGDMKSAIESAIKSNQVVVLDGSEGDFMVSSSISVTSNRTIIGINNARLCTQWYVTDEIKKALDDAGVPNMSTSSGGGTLPNGKSVTEQAEYNTRKIIIEMTGDNSENYQKSGIFTLNKTQNIIIRNLKLVGPGSIDVGGNDLISCTGAKHCWVDHCDFTDGMDGNFDITKSADFNTVSWCTFSYTDRSYMHQNTNLVGSGDRFTMDEDHLNTTYAFNWWGTGCNQRMPMARFGTIHMLNNYYSCTGAERCINARKDSEFLIEGNYFAEGVRKVFSQTGAKRWTWAPGNYCAEPFTPTSSGDAVTMPYDYAVAPAADVPDLVRSNAGATLFAQNDD